MTTPNMSLVLPVDHASADVWDVVLDAVFNLIDAHDHTSGKGVQIPSAAIGVNADVSWAGFALTHAKGVAFTEQAAASVSSYSDLLYVDSTTHDLMFRNSTGTNVKITDGATLNVSIVGGIGGDYSTAGALESFDDATKRYLLQSEGTPRPWSGLATADIDLYEKAASIVQAVKIKSPSGLAAGYTLTLPTALPSSRSALTVTTAGQIATQAGLWLNRQVFTAGGTYTPTAGTTKVLVRMVGGGGGGGGSASLGVAGNAAPGGGGGSGVYLEKLITSVTSGGAVAIGAAGGAGTSTTDGGTGGDSTIVINAATITARGGIGGVHATGGASSENSGGGTSAGSSAADVSFWETGGTGVNGGHNGFSGFGGSSPLGRGGRPVYSYTGTERANDGITATGYGSGGSGSITASNGAASGTAVGGAGSAGVVIIDEFM